MTNGDSCTSAERVRRRIPTQMRIESMRMVVTSTMKKPHTRASSRALKMRVCVYATRVAVIAPVSSAASSWRASARNPRRGSGEKIFGSPR